jgi:hypothetical protein
VPGSSPLEEQKRDRQRPDAELLGRSEVRVHDQGSPAGAEVVVEATPAT